MTQDGEVLRFDAERGFGFIATADGQRNIFFHVRDFRGDGVPRAGERVRFERIEVGGKGPRAMAVQPLAGTRPSTASGRTDRPQAPGRPAAARPSTPPRARQTAPSVRTGTEPARRGQASAHRAERRQPTDRAPRGLDGQPALFTLALFAWAGLLAALTWRQAWPVSPLIALGGLALLNLATFMVYALDKDAAARGGWRTAENHLHLLALLGGWPAAWLAQRALRHKSRKQPFLTVYVLTALLNLGALAVLLWHAG